VEADILMQTFSMRVREVRLWQAEWKRQAKKNLWVETARQGGAVFFWRGNWPAPSFFLSPRFPFTLRTIPFLERLWLEFKQPYLPLNPRTFQPKHYLQQPHYQNRQDGVSYHFLACSLSLAQRPSTPLAICLLREQSANRTSVRRTSPISMSWSSATSTPASRLR